MLETVMILPLLMLLISYMFQLFIVLLAREMTYYAAYCGARAALVYNPSDYSEDKDGGVVKEAACTALAWISQSVEGSKPLRIPAINDDYTVPRSDSVRQQVSVSIEEGLLTDEKKLKELYAGRPSSVEEFPVVAVTVTFNCPLLIPIGGRIFSGLARTPHDKMPNGDPVADLVELTIRGAEVEEGRGWLYNYIGIQDTCVLGKPYNTFTFPLIPKEDAFIRGEEEE